MRVAREQILVNMVNIFHQAISTLCNHLPIVIFSAFSSRQANVMDSLSSPGRTKLCTLHRKRFSHNWPLNCAQLRERPGISTLIALSPWPLHNAEQHWSNCRACMCCRTDGLSGKVSISRPGPNVSSGGLLAIYTEIIPGRCPAVRLAVQQQLTAQHG